MFLSPRQGAGRVDEPHHEYLVLYLGDTAEGAVAEAFGRFAHWAAAVLDVPSATAPGTVKALARYEGAPDILDLDDPYVLQKVGLCPSGVVSRDRSATQPWASDIHDSSGHDGLSWRSFYDPHWSSFGVWNIGGLKPTGDPEVLTMDHPAVVSAATTIRRVIV